MSPSLYQIYSRRLGSTFVASYDSQGYGACALGCNAASQSLSKIRLQPTVSQPCLGVRQPSGTRDQYSFHFL
jgi:hypothetical protein